MRVFILISVFIFAIAACKHKKTISLDSHNKPSEFNTYNFKNSDFEGFYTKFINDTVFQLSRVKFPINGNYADYAREYNWSRDKWPAIKWDLREEIKNTTDSVFIEQTDTSFFFGEYCRDCGFSFEMAFKKLKGEWYLILRQENNY